MEWMKNWLVTAPGVFDSSFSLSLRILLFRNVHFVMQYIFIKHPLWIMGSGGTEETWSSWQEHETPCHNSAASERGGGGVVHESEVKFQLRLKLEGQHGWFLFPLYRWKSWGTKTWYRFSKLICSWMITVLCSAFETWLVRQPLGKTVVTDRITSTKCLGWPLPHAQGWVLKISARSLVLKYLGSPYVLEKCTR